MIASQLTEKLFQVPSLQLKAIKIIVELQDPDLSPARLAELKPEFEPAYKELKTHYKLITATVGRCLNLKPTHATTTPLGF